MLLLTGSCALAVLTITSQFLLSRKLVAGWYVIIAAQVFWTAYDILTKQYGFLVLTPVSTFIALQGVRRWNNGTAASTEGNYQAGNQD